MQSVSAGKDTINNETAIFNEKINIFLTKSSLTPY